jgi:starch synthase
VTTVSPRYAIELQYPRFGEGLEGLLRIRNQQGDVVGILNGMDLERWSPATDPWIVHHYTADNVAEGKIQNKLHLQKESGMQVRPDVPLIGMVTRLVEQKGVDIAIPALRELLANTDVQFVILGSGEKALEMELWRLCSQYSWKARAYMHYDPVLSQRIYAASDLFLMPSRYEPCGTGQMLAMRYGTLPIVRETGGLADTVQNYDNGNGDVGNGFVFSWENSDAILNTIRWALDTYRFRKDAFHKMQLRGMSTDFSWDQSALQYIYQYERALTRHVNLEGTTRKLPRTKR